MLSDENLSKLAWLEKMAKEYLDDFIDSRDDKDGVGLKRFPGHVAWAHEYNLRDYIGRSERAIQDFVSKRSYLWHVDHKENVTKIPNRMRQILSETAAFLVRQRKQAGDENGTKLADILAMLESKSILGPWPSKFVKATLLQYPELFTAELRGDQADDENARVLCVVDVVNGSILPQALTSTITGGVAKALAVTPLPGAVAAVGIKNPMTSTSGGSSTQKGSSASTSSEPSNTSSGTAANETVEGVGVVVAVYDSHGFLYFKPKHIDVIFHWSVFDIVLPTTLPKRIKVGDRLAFKAYVFVDGSFRKWRASFVSRDLSMVCATTGKSKSNTGSISEDDWTTLGDKSRNLSLPAMAPSSINQAAIHSKEDIGINCQVHLGLPSPNIGNESVVATPDFELSIESSEKAALNFDLLAIIDQELESIVEDELSMDATESAIIYADASIQTDLTDEEILLRLLSSFPNLLDDFEIARRT